MPYIIRNKQGVMVGHCTNKPGPGNKLPDGSEEVHEFYDSEPAKLAEVAAFNAAQEAKIAQMKSPAARVVEQIKADPEALAALKAELAK